MGKRYSIPLLITVLGLVAFCLYHFISARVVLNEQATYQIFADLVVFIVALMAVLVAIVGFFGYQWLRHRFEDMVEDETKKAKDELQDVREQIIAEAKELNSETRVTFHIAVCTLWGMLYERELSSTKYLEAENNRGNAPKFTFLIELAVQHARKAHSAAMELDQEKHGELICRAKNNLALSLALRCHPEDAKEANDLAHYVYAEAEKFPATLEASWKETYTYVLWTFPLKKNDKPKASEIFLELIERPDIAEGEKNSWLERWQHSGFVPPATKASSLD